MTFTHVKNHALTMSCSSPLSCISLTTSRPPTNSPLMISCGNVGHSFTSFNSVYAQIQAHSMRISTTRKMGRGRGDQEKEERRGRGKEEKKRRKARTLSDAFVLEDVERGIVDPFALEDPDNLLREAASAGGCVLAAR